MTDSLRTLLATPGIHRQIGCSESTVSRWRTDPNRRPVAAFAGPLIALAPELADEIRAWCTYVPPTPVPMRAPREMLTGEPTRMIAFRAPVSIAEGIEHLKRPGDTTTDVILDAIVGELTKREREAARRDDFESRPDTRHHIDGCRTEGNAVDYGCAKCAAKH